MEVKHTLQGLLIYIVMVAYVVAFIVLALRRKRAGAVASQAGFVLALVAFGYRWYDAAHVPFQNLFEVFLFMGVMVYPLSVFCRRRLGVGAAAADMLIGAIVLFPAGFVFSAEPQKLPPALQCWLFAPHVAVYLLAYVIMAKATIQAFGQLFCKNPGVSDGGAPLCDYEVATYRMVGLGFPFLTLGLILGSWWGKLAWGDWWGWDPKELWSLVSWLAYAGYLHFRFHYGRKHPKTNSMLVISGMVFILITLLWANLSRLFSGLHSYAS